MISLSPQTHPFVACCLEFSRPFSTGFVVRRCAVRALKEGGLRILMTAGTSPQRGRGEHALREEFILATTGEDEEERV